MKLFILLVTTSAGSVLNTTLWNKILVGGNSVKWFLFFFWCYDQVICNQIVVNFFVIVTIFGSLDRVWSQIFAFTARYWCSFMSFLLTFWVELVIDSEAYLEYWKFCIKTLWGRYSWPHTLICIRKIRNRYALCAVTDIQVEVCNKSLFIFNVCLFLKVLSARVAE